MRCTRTRSTPGRSSRATTPPPFEPRSGWRRRSAGSAGRIAGIPTEWDAFRVLDLARLKAAMRGAVLVDLRNVYRADEVTKHGFAYLGVGQAGDEARAVHVVAERERNAALLRIPSASRVSRYVIVRVRPS